MNQEIVDDKLLSKNSISQFILKFDLYTNQALDFSLIMNDISKYFDRTEKKTQTNFLFNINTNNSEVNKTEGFNYVLVNDTRRYSLTFSSSQNSITFETTNYFDKNTYSSIISELILSAQRNNMEFKSKRIGMRFINNFNCLNIKNISKILNLSISKNLSRIALQENISRIICQEEFNYDDSKIRLQYGIPNKFYPAILKNFDLLIDIDSYDDTIQEITNWANIISNLNHSAYKTFIHTINDKFLTTLK
jgi:uncharacterized protein (TIGR04255 family)